MTDKPGTYGVGEPVIELRSTIEVRSTIKPTDENTCGATTLSVGSATDSSMTGTGVETDSGLGGGTGVPAPLKAAELTGSGDSKWLDGTLVKPTCT